MTDLNEMWQELERYQPFAEKHGFGEAWKRMTTERTEDAAKAAMFASVAWDAAAGAAGEAAACAAYAANAAEWKKYAITYIRKAIEKEQT